MKEAMFYTKTDNGAVRCRLCAQACRIPPGRAGLCGVRQNENGVLHTLVYDKIVSANADPIEKKPLFHFLPGTTSFSIATVGCNFICRHCQNHEISQYPRLHGAVIGRPATPAGIVAAAGNQGCASISYTYIEPTVFFELAIDTAMAARDAGLRNVFVSNGYTSSEAARAIAPYLDANNIDLKSFSDTFYREICGARLAPVLATIELMKELGVWVEVTTLIIPGLNDSDKELEAIATYIHGVDPDIPWHVSRFHPAHAMTDREATPPATLHRARAIGQAAGLRHVYTGNIPGQGGEDTTCPGCGAIVISRRGYATDSGGLDLGRCAKCSQAIAGIWR